MKKSTGIMRRVDELGRVVLPMELRNKFGITEKDPMEIFVDSDMIILKKYEKSCTFCDSTTKLIEFNEKLICDKCLKQIKKI